jgi:hypothetical protein
MGIKLEKSGAVEKMVARAEVGNYERVGADPSWNGFLVVDRRVKRPVRVAVHLGDNHFAGARELTGNSLPLGERDAEAAGTRLLFGHDERRDPWRRKRAAPKDDAFLVSCTVASKMVLSFVRDVAGHIEDIHQAAAFR